MSAVVLSHVEIVGVGSKVGGILIFDLVEPQVEIIGPRPQPVLFVQRGAGSVRVGLSGPRVSAGAGGHAQGGEGRFRRKTDPGTQPDVAPEPPAAVVPPPPPPQAACNAATAITACTPAGREILIKNFLVVNYRDSNATRCRRTLSAGEALRNTQMICSQLKFVFIFAHGCGGSHRGVSR